MGFQSDKSVVALLWACFRRLMSPVQVAPVQVMTPLPGLPYYLVELQPGVLCDRLYKYLSEIIARRM